MSSKINTEVLALLEKGDEEYKVNNLKEQLHLSSDRNARVVLHILENNPEKYSEKLEKEIAKREDKLIKEYKKIHKKMQSYIYEKMQINHEKVEELKTELEELHSLL